MTTIVKHRRTGNAYILLGINGEGDKANPSRFISELFSPEKSDVSCSATVCDVQGNIFLAYIDDLIVIEIEGKKPADILPQPDFNSVSNDDYQQESDDFADDLEDNFEDEELVENQENPKMTTDSSSSSVYSQNQAEQSKLANDDDDDWI
ncbi:hypothetical protein [Pleurocapsa sp. PCC 7319]|uniref:hypothetical protein n=1 Tax=Pleurocapsa sp. PCC 7319 TaxID=118161 RepID=UPI000345F4E9|nr:hypothetical protein [Pleurocapsa sp. PCC 7319]